MSKRRRQSYSGCSVSVKGGQLRLRFRAVMPDGTSKQIARATGYADTAENRVRLRPLAKLVGAALEAGKTLAEIDEILKKPTRRPDNAEIAAHQRGTGPTVSEYFTGWIKEQEALARKAQLRDYRRHFRIYIHQALGGIPLSELRASDVRGFQADLLMRGKSVKYVKNIVSGTFRAMIRQAKADERVVRDVFAGMQWPAWEPPDPDPLTPDERKRIIEWFRNKRFGFHPGAGTTQHRWLPHPSYHAYVLTLFWTGLRPSEASGLRWGDIDIANRRLSVRRSRHLGQYGAPKTKQARREVELFPELARVLSDLQPLQVAPSDPVFKNTCGEPIEPKAFSRHWYDCLRVLDIRQRGLYCTKDTFVTMALGIGVKIAWLEAQTGVRYETLRRHYGKWVPLERDSELNRFEESDPELFHSRPGKLCPQLSTDGAQSRKNVMNSDVEKCEEGDLNPQRSLP